MATINRAELRKAHEELDRTMTQADQGLLSKAMATLRGIAGIDAEEDLSKANSKPMPRGASKTGSSTGDMQYPNGEGAEARIAAARSKSKDGHLADNNYDDLPEAEDDTTEYETKEDDILNGAAKGKPVTSKTAKKSLASIDEETIYKSLIDNADPEMVQTIEATEALTFTVETMAKSISAVSTQVNTGYEALAKSIAGLAQGLLAIAQEVEGLKVAAPLAKSEAEAEVGEEPTEKSQAKVDEAPLQKSEAPATEVVELTTEQKRWMATSQFMDQVIAQNAPTFLRKSMGGADKAQAEGSLDIDGPNGKRILADALKKSMANGSIPVESGANALGNLDWKSPREIVNSLPAQMRGALGL